MAQDRKYKTKGSNYKPGNVTNIVKEISEGDGHEPVVQVQPDFELIAFDFVSNPSTHGAFMSPMNEGIDPNSNIKPSSKVEALINDILRGE